MDFRETEQSGWDSITEMTESISVHLPLNLGRKLLKQEPLYSNMNL